MATCPACQYTRTADDSGVHADICPRCGIVYWKWLQKHSADATEATVAVKSGEKQTLLEWLTEAPESVDAMAFWARAAGALGFALWTLYFISHGIDWEIIGGSFLHGVNLAFHEFGHLFFSPFGRFMTILGGSLFQVLWPWTFLLAFLFKYRDTFAASIMLWWGGQNFIDLAPYIGDAYYRGLPLVGGGGEESHDWGNLLTMTGLLEQYQAIARASFFIGSVMMIAALVWAGMTLRVQWRLLEK